MLSVVIPCYNERSIIESIITAARLSPFRHKEILVVDDVSTDGAGYSGAKGHAAHVKG